MNDLARLFPYVANRNETLEQQTARLRAELQATNRASDVRLIANDNERERKPEWWQTW